MKLQQRNTLPCFGSIYDYKTECLTSTLCEYYYRGFSYGMVSITIMFFIAKTIKVAPTPEVYKTLIMLIPAPRLH